MKLKPADKFEMLWVLCAPKWLRLVPEVRVCEDRKWRFDFAVPERKVAFEIQGVRGFCRGRVVHGRHSRPEGMKSDAEKLNRATMDGWAVFLLTPDMVYEETIARMVAWVAVRKTGNGVME